jgi:hypothetical protein
MNYDFAICYFGLTRSTKKIYQNHYENIFNILDKNNLKYEKFMHTWSTKNDTQRIWSDIITKKIDYNEYKLLNPDIYKIESQEETFLNNINFNNFFYQEVYERVGNNKNGEWLPYLVLNHICALESMKRSLEMVEDNMKKGNNYKYIMFIRPDLQFKNKLPIHHIINNINKISIPNFDHFEGYNDRFAIMNYSNACLYGKRINEIIEFRKNNGRIVSEKYVKFIINKYKIPVNLIDFNFDIIRP